MLQQMVEASKRNERRERQHKKSSSLPCVTCIDQRQEIDSLRKRLEEMTALILTMNAKLDKIMGPE